MDLTSSRARKNHVAYTPELADDILKRLAEGMALIEVCALPGMPTRETVYNWRLKDPAFRARMIAAQEVHADALMDEIVPIADTDKDPQTARNRIDARIKRAGSIKPKEYGPRVDLNVTTQVDYSQAHAEAKARLRLMRDLPQTLVAQVVDGVEVFAPCATDNESVDAAAVPTRPSIFD